MKHRVFNMGDYSVVEIHNRRQSKYFYVLVDTEDLKKIENAAERLLIMCSRYTNYCVVRGKKHCQYTKGLHRLIMDTPKGLEVDHINHNGLDNRKNNLRNCTRSENLANRRPRSHIFNQGVKQT